MPARKRKMKTCHYCGKQYEQTVKTQGYCSVACRDNFDKQMRAFCPECGESFLRRRTWQKWCSEKCGRTNWMRLHPRVKLGVMPR